MKEVVFVIVNDFAGIILGDCLVLCVEIGIYFDCVLVVVL